MEEIAAEHKKLINMICNEEVAEVGDGQESMTQDVTHYVKVVNGHQNGRKVNGLLYLRDISKSEMTGTAMKDMELFQRLCGDDALNNVILLTTMWVKSEPGVGQEREQEVVSKFWNRMIEPGASLSKRLSVVSSHILGTVEPISDFIATMLKFQLTLLQIQRELGNGINLIDTAAGQVIDHDLSAAIAENEETLQSIKEALNVSRKISKSTLEEQAIAYQVLLGVARNDRNALNEDFEKVMYAEEERRSHLFGFRLPDRFDALGEELDPEEQTLEASVVEMPSIRLSQPCEHV
ncbi:uncharacterized protein KY384_001340 [Bacidia gigantensis]|uniref:uncharacterized protein n=1 Tax=Bacidia gigantensis TaxID=2732470 RepID=UPI001D050B34|nr:uncharacterized protein KY384_001340 [Bacidia gigantensis]KAG8533600.1 hypothetical protein KY384_001340 [Bacidia gigantensis]